jgi:hypothetical protein
MTYAVITGCSHTAGAGIDINDCYVSLIQQHYGFPIKNWAVPGGGCIDVLKKVADAVRDPVPPKFIVAQWPNVFRKPLWIKEKRNLQNIHFCEESFMMLLKHSEKNFYEPWMQSVELANLLCQLAHVPLINIMLENLDQPYMDQLRVAHIELHVDEKLPGRTWFFDSKARDNLHHSSWCHRAWADRLIGIIDATATR